MARHGVHRSKAIARVASQQSNGWMWKLAIAAFVTLALTFAFTANRAHAGGKYLAGAIVGGIVAGAIIHHAHKHHHKSYRVVRHRPHYVHKPVRVVRYHRPVHVYQPVIVVPLPYFGVRHGW